MLINQTSLRAFRAGSGKMLSVSLPCFWLSSRQQEQSQEPMDGENTSKVQRWVSVHPLWRIKGGRTFEWAATSPQAFCLVCLRVLAPGAFDLLTTGHSVRLTLLSGPNSSVINPKHALTSHLSPHSLSLSLSFTVLVTEKKDLRGPGCVSGLCLQLRLWAS